jgi:hypothetical protein
MASNKAAGLAVEFYHHYWDIVKWDVMKLFHAFHASTLDVHRLNYGVITLIQKIVGANKISQYRPICLLRCIYKLITKTLTIRLEPYIKKTIGMNQNDL